MRKNPCLWAVLVIMAIQVGILTGARADVVGHLTEVTGQVDIMKDGKFPATPAKLQDGVEPGDVVRTKSASKAQITLIDNSTITIAPESKVAIEDYMFEPAQKKRNAVFQLFRGLAYVVVNKVFKVQNPDFIVKTHTAIMGVRGTEFGIRLYPASSTILNFKGVLEVGNFYPEISRLSHRASKIALSLGGGRIAWINSVLLHAMQGATVASDLPPATFKVTPGMMKSFMNQMVSRLESRQERKGSQNTGTQVTSAEGFSGTTGGTDTGSHSETPNPGFQAAGFNNPMPTTTPPPVLPVVETVPPPSTPTLPTYTTYSFSLDTYGPFSQSPAVSAGSPVLFTASGSAILKGDLASLLPTNNYDVTDFSTLTPTSGTFPSTRVNGSYSASMVGTVSGNQGSTLTGSATIQSSYVSSVYTVLNNYTVVVTFDLTSGLTTYTYNYDGYTYSYAGGLFNSSDISGTSAGNVSVSLESDSMTMTTMAASADPPLLTATPDSANGLIVSPATTLGSSSYAGTARGHRHIGIRRHFFGPKVHHGRFKPCLATALHSPNHVAAISHRASVVGHHPWVRPRPLHVGFALTSTITDPDVPALRRVIRGNAATPRVGAVTGARSGGKTGSALPATARKAKSPLAVAGPGHHHNLPRTVNIAPEGPRNGVLKTANPVIPVGMRATPTRISATPVGPQPEPGPVK
jgi:hypothetical protein